ncbi:MAG: MBL fold metallo-hydrolase [Candidatus Goldiibacteriota bacterium]
MKVKLIGTGTSHGIPVAGCSCDVCMSKNPKNIRYRSSALIASGGKNIIIDVPAEFRLRSLEYGIKRIDAVLLTHSHADHTAGMDDIRRYNEIQGADIPLFADPDTLEETKKRFSYMFTHTQEGGGKPKLKTHSVNFGNEFSAEGVKILPLDVKHGCLVITGYRTGGFAYLTDVSGIPEYNFSKLEDLDVLVLDALRTAPHPTHFNLEQAVDAAKRIGAKKTYFTHISHSLEHDAVNSQLPEGMELAYDGIEFQARDAGEYGEKA